MVSANLTLKKMTLSIRHIGAFITARYFAQPAFDCLDQVRIIDKQIGHATIRLAPGSPVNVLCMAFGVHAIIKWLHRARRVILRYRLSFKGSQGFPAENLILCADDSYQSITFQPDFPEKILLFARSVDRDIMTDQESFRRFRHVVAYSGAVISKQKIISLRNNRNAILGLSAPLHFLPFQSIIHETIKPPRALLIHSKSQS